jgi:uncharacterized membrane-anchored protein YhcB (DUF1043 family)
MPSIGQTWVLASIGVVIEMSILSTLKRLLMESTRQQEVLHRENALKACIVRQGGRFEFTANKLFKFHDVIAHFRQHLLSHTESQ